jgi:hypothetical protein
MKTTYLKPEMDVLYYAAEQLMSASKPITETGGNLNEAPETTETSGNLSRRKDIWADDEEEEEEMY